MSASKTLKLWIHDDRFSSHDIILNSEFHPGIEVGDIVEVWSTAKRTGLFLQVVKVEDDLIKKNAQLQVL